MARRNRMSISFDGFEEYMEKLDKLQVDVKPTINKALKESKKQVNERLEKDMQIHNQTHATIDSLDKNEDVEWNGTKAIMKVGFNISKGGLASIFLMYGTPKMAPDTKIKNDIYGTAIKKKVSKLQEEIFMEAVKKVMG